MMRRLARTWVLVSIAALLLVSPGIAVGADPPQGGHPRSHPARSERVGPVHPISGGVAISGGAAIQAVPTGTVDVVSAVWWIDGSNYLNIAGEVVNTMSTRQQYVEIVATIKVAADNVVGTTTTYADLDQLAPGMTSSFLGFVSAPPGAASVWLAVDPGTVVTAMPEGALRVDLGTPYTDTYGWRHYPGTLVNRRHRQRARAEHQPRCPGSDRKWLRC